MLTGKGMYVWQISQCEKGDTALIAKLARDSGLSHVMVKVADGPGFYNVAERDHALALIRMLKTYGIQAWGWQYIYGISPIDEADTALERIHDLDLDGFVVNAEKEFKQPGREKAAQVYMRDLRRGLKREIPIAFSSYRYPEFHPLPWEMFLDMTDIVMPQVYWIQAHNPAAQLIECVKQYKALGFAGQIIPTGAAFQDHDWTASPAEVTTFMATAKSMGLPAVNFWDWQHARKIVGMWEEIASFDYGPSVPVPPPPAPSQKKIRVITGRLNVRLQPDVNAGKVIGVVEIGQELNPIEYVTDKDGNRWAKISTYVAMDYKGQKMAEEVK